MKVLVTGGAGYKGGPLTRVLLDAGHEVTVFDNFLYGYDGILPLLRHDKLRVVKGDIRNPDRPYLAGQDAVFHLAGVSGLPACEANPSSAQSINVDATREISRELSKDQLLIYASTTSLYGASGADGAVSSEESAVSPVSHYGITKLRAEELVMERERSISLRWPTIFGISPRMRAGLLIHDFVQRAVQEGTVVLFAGDSRRTFLHVEDCAAGYRFALDHAEVMQGQIFNVGDQTLNLSKREIAEKIAQLVPLEIVDSTRGDRDVRHFDVTFEKIRKLGYATRQTIDDGLTELVKLYEFYDPASPVRPI